jgi:hypothetical protein
MMADANMVGPASISLGQTIGSFTSMLPRFTDIRHADPGDTEIITDVRLGEVAASTIAIGTGVIISSLTGSPVPAFVALLMAVVLICIYETALRSNGNANQSLNA